MAVSPDSDADALRAIPFFEGLSVDHLKLIAGSAESRSLPEKLLLYDEGQLLHSAYVIMSGSMRARRWTVFCVSWMLPIPCARWRSAMKLSNRC